MARAKIYQNQVIIQCAILFYPNRGGGTKSEKGGMVKTCIHTNLKVIFERSHLLDFQLKTQCIWEIINLKCTGYLYEMWLKHDRCFGPK